jgi:hypothetical protein
MSIYWNAFKVHSRINARYKWDLAKIERLGLRELNRNAAKYGGYWGCFSLQQKLYGIYSKA